MPRTKIGPSYALDLAIKLRDVLLENMHTPPTAPPSPSTSISPPKSPHTPPMKPTPAETQWFTLRTFKIPRYTPQRFKIPPHYPSAWEMISLGYFPYGDKKRPRVFKSLALVIKKKESSLSINVSLQQWGSSRWDFLKNHKCRYNKKIEVNNDTIVLIGS